MKLLLDIGNTRIKWGFLIAGGVQDGGQVTHRGAAMTDALSFLRHLPHVPDGVLATNVAGERIGAAVRAAVEDRFELPVRFAATGRTHGRLRNGYRSIRHLGVDRWLAMVAAVHRHDGALCVVDAGTAVTVDLIDAEGRHLGGLIVPGLGLMAQSLQCGTIQIHAAMEQPSAAGGAENSWPGRDTDAAVGEGGRTAEVGLIEHCMRWMRDNGAHHRLVVTGGSYPQFEPLLRRASPGIEVDHRPALVLEGLAWVEQERAGRSASR